MAVQQKLSSRQRRFLLDQGYLVVRSQLDPAVLARVRDRLEELVRQTVAAWADDPSLDTTEACGRLRVIPGSHRHAAPPFYTEHGYVVGMGPHPDEVKIIAPAGSVILFNAADLWHSGTFNYTPAARLALTVHIDPGHRRCGQAAALGTTPVHNGLLAAQIADCFPEYRTIPGGRC